MKAALASQVAVPDTGPATVAGWAAWPVITAVGGGIAAGDVLAGAGPITTLVLGVAAARSAQGHRQRTRTEPRR